MSSSTVTYTFVYTDSEPWRFQWVSDEEPEAHAEAPPSPDYVSGLAHLPSPDYVPGPEEPEQAPLSLDYVPQPKYPEYLVSSDAEEPMVDQPLPDDASPTTLSPGYIADFDPEEDPEEDPADYHADVGDDADDESSDDDDDDDDEEEEEEDEDEENLAPIDSSVVPTVDPVPSAEDTKAFKTDEFTPTPPSPRSRRARISVRLPSPMSASMEARIAEFASAPTPPLPPPSLLSLLSLPLPQIPSPPLLLPSPPTTSPTYAEALLGYKAAGIRLRAVSPPTHHLSEIPSPPLLLPSTSHRDDILEADLPPRKRLCLTAPTPRFEVGESSSVAAARQVERSMSREVGYRITETWDELVDTIQEIALTTLEGVNQRVTELATTMSRDTHEIHIRLEDAQDDRALQRG
ncbi:hypothetical protein Tco_1313006 [Tanacetum coccineum]